MSNTGTRTPSGDPIMREGDAPSARFLEETGRLARNLVGVEGTTCTQRNGRWYIKSGSGMPTTEWTVSITGTNATIGVRPVVFAGRVIPDLWGTEEDLDYGAPGTWYPATLTLLDLSDVGLGSGFIYAEIDLDADTIECKHSVTRPKDDPALSIVRWPLVHITQTETTVGSVTTYSFSIDTVLHFGQIKLPALFAP